MPLAYEDLSLTREQVDAWVGPALLEFGANGCGHCQQAQPAIAEALKDHPTLRHVKVEDGPGRRLGRSFRVKLWPTLIFFKDGQEVSRAVRPQGVEAVQQGLTALLG